MVKQQYPTAKVFPVPVGNLTVEGLMLEDGSYAIAVPQIVNLFDYDTQNYGVQTLERMMGKDFKTHKISVVTPFNKNKTIAVTLEWFERVLIKLDRSGNEKAQAFRDALCGLSLYQLFSDAVGVELTKESRQAFLKARQQGKEVRRTLTDELKDYCDIHDVSDNYKKFIYLNVSRVITEALFGRNPKKLAEDWGVPQNQLRDSMTPKELQHLESFERTIMKYLRDTGKEPHQAVKDFVSLACMKPEYTR